jgi:hypothetical protein
LRFGYSYNIIVFSALIIAVMFFHIYTWTILAAVVGIFLIAMLLMQNNKNNNNSHFDKRRIIWLLLAILLSIVVDISRVSLTGSSGGLEQDMEIAQRTLGLEQFNLRWQTLNMTMHDSLGGVFSNFIIFILGLAWILKSNLREPGTVFLMIFLSIGLIPLFLDVPFEIPAAIALYYISTRAGSVLVTVADCTWLVAVSLFTVMNYYLILVPGVQ